MPKRWADGERVEFSAHEAVVRCVVDANGRDLQGRGPVFDCDPIPSFLLDRVHAGGLLAQLKRRFQEQPAR